MNNKSIYEMPKILDDGRLDTIIEILENIRLKKNIELSFKNTVAISPAGHAIISTIFDVACEHNIEIKLLDIKHHINKNIIQYSQNEKPLKGFKEISQLGLDDKNQIIYGKVSSIAPEFIQKLNQKFSNTLSEDDLFDVSLILNELMQNAVDHSTAERYFLYAGVFNNKFEFGVLDVGVSIPSKLETKYVCKNDKEYLEKSLIKGIGTRRNRTGGMGLYYLFENIKKAKGRLVLISRDAQARLNFSTRNYLYKDLKKSLYGTWCMASFPMED